MSGARTAASLLYACTIFVSAFLLFQIQPMIGKVILPWFGGAAMVWTTCMLFFQGLLLAGYLYTHWTVRVLPPKLQALLHLVLLGTSLLLLPVTPRETWKPSGPENPTLRILTLLASAIGLPYFLLSTTGPLIQAWYVRTEKSRLPYRLFALSNFGSLLALLTYPVVVEPLLGVRPQTLCWSWTYVAFVFLCGCAALLSFRLPPAEPLPAVASPAPEASPPSWGLCLLWVALAACGSAILLAATNHLSANVAPIPLLWVLPLSLYLLSFILCFEGHGWYQRRWCLWLLLLAFAGMNYGLTRYRDVAGVAAVTAAFLASIFIFCMVCHGELAALKPHPRYLTSFYLMCALGGALGGIFVGLVAPYLFRGLYELAIAMAACMFVPAFALRRAGAPAASSPRIRARGLAVLAAVLLVYICIHISIIEGGARLRVRNFYGALRIFESGSPGRKDWRRGLAHGVIEHGEQFLDPARRREPTAYYGPLSGGGLALLEPWPLPRRVGVIGLGAGVLSTYGRPGDYYRFYEINPLIIRLANTEFFFLHDSPARVDVVLADGRLALEREPGQQFDVLEVDAFSGDSIPVHLLTREAFRLYFRHLKETGVLALHISNTYLDLAPVVAMAAQDLGKEFRLVVSPASAENRWFEARWMLVTSRAAFFRNPEVARKAVRLAAPSRLRLWTDDYSNLLAAFP